MTELYTPSEAKSRPTLLLVWAIAATILGLLSSGLAILLWVQLREAPPTHEGWFRWETSAGGNGHWYKAVAPTDGLIWTEADRLARLSGHHHLRGGERLCFQPCPCARVFREGQWAGTRRIPAGPRPGAEWRLVLGQRRAVELQQLAFERAEQWQVRGRHRRSPAIL